MAEMHLVSAASCKRSARLFNLLAVASTLLSGALFLLGSLIADQRLAILPMAMAMPPIAIWLGASIFVYASIAHHPDLTVRHYHKWAGYRYYALIGTLPIVPLFIEHLPGGWWSVATILLLALVPWSLWDIWRAGQENWQDLEVETHKHG